jgi:hypothetical protein
MPGVRRHWTEDTIQKQGFRHMISVVRLQIYEALRLSSVAGNQSPGVLRTTSVIMGVGTPGSGAGQLLLWETNSLETQEHQLETICPDPPWV